MATERSWIQGAFLWLLVTAISCGAAIGVNRLLGGGMGDRALLVALALLSFNLLMFLVAWLFRRHPPAVAPLALGLMWFALKFLVNLHVLLLVMGLKLVAARVFVPVFFAGYIPALFGGILLLHLMSMEKTVD